MLDFALAVAMIVGTSEVLKQQGIAKKFIPVFNLALGVVAGAFFMGLEWQEGVVQGILIGLSASGLYDMHKPLIRGGK